MKFTMDQLAAAGGQQITPAQAARVQMERSVRVVSNLLGGKDANFTLAELRKAVQMVWGQTYDVRNFYRDWTTSGYIIDTELQIQGKRGRPARLYRFTGKGLV